MPWYIYVFLAFLVVTVCVAIRWKTYKVPTSEGYSRSVREEAEVKKIFFKWTTVGLGVITFLVLLGSTTNFVPTNTIRVVTEFGKPVDSFGNGFHFTAPWTKTVDFDAARQPLRFQGDTKDGDTIPKLRVRMSGEAYTDVTGVVTWQVPKEKAPDLYTTWKSFERVRDFVVSANLQQALNAALDDYNPLDFEKNVSYAELSNSATTELRKLIGNQVNVLSVVIANMDHDQATDQAIANKQAELAKTDLAKQQQKTNKELAAANANLATPNFNPVAECLSIVREKGGEPGYCLMNGGTPVVSPRKAP